MVIYTCVVVGTPANVSTSEKNLLIEDVIATEHPPPPSFKMHEASQSLLLVIRPWYVGLEKKITVATYRVFVPIANP